MARVARPVWPRSDLAQLGSLFLAKPLANETISAEADAKPLANETISAEADGCLQARAGQLVKQYWILSLLLTLQKKFKNILTIVFLTKIATVWDDTRIVPCDSQLWEIQCTWSSYRNNWMLLGLEVYLDKCYTQQKGIVPLQWFLSCELQCS